MRFFGLIGKSLVHSFSPVFFREKFDKEGINDCFYNLYPLKNIDEFTQLISDFTELKGLNVTIPYKQEVIPFLDELDPDAAIIGAINTIKFERNTYKLKLKGYNTDYLGFTDSIKPLLKNHHQKALILGTGGSSLAVSYALKKMGISYKFVSRKPLSDEIFSYKSLNEDIINDFKIIINTTPIGMFPDIEKKPDIPYQAVTREHLLYDLTYNPDLSEFLRTGKERGASIKNGLEMLVIQAEYAWKIWNNIKLK